jgi:hypothetical protein
MALINSFIVLLKPFIAILIPLFRDSLYLFYIPKLRIEGFFIEVGMGRCI